MAMREAFRRAGLEVPNEPEERDEMTTRGNPQNRRTATCSDCGRTFEPRQPHFRRCDDCQREMRASGTSGGQQQRGRRSLGSQPMSKEIPEFPTSYFVTDGDNRHLDTVFVSKKGVDPLAEHLARARPGLTTGQIRRFFNHCRVIERRLDNGETWGQVASGFEMLSAHAQYATSAQKIPQDFQKFIDSNVKRVMNSDDQLSAFRDGFMKHFEALLAFGSAYMTDR